MQLKENERINLPDKYLVIDDAGNLIDKFRLKAAAEIFLKKYNREKLGVVIKAKVVEASSL